jgi:hypothetical protein
LLSLRFSQADAIFAADRFHYFDFRHDAAIFDISAFAFARHFIDYFSADIFSLSPLPPPDTALFSFSIFIFFRWPH